MSFFIPFYPNTPVQNGRRHGLGRVLGMTARARQRRPNGVETGRQLLLLREVGHQARPVKSHSVRQSASGGAWRVTAQSLTSLSIMGRKKNEVKSAAKCFSPAARLLMGYAREKIGFAGADSASSTGRGKRGQHGQQKFRLGALGQVKQQLRATSPERLTADRFAPTKKPLGQTPVFLRASPRPRAPPQPTSQSRAWWQTPPSRPRCGCRFSPAASASGLPPCAG
jgi:hypothetical protein